MKTLTLIISLLGTSSAFGYSDCPRTNNWLKDGFCELTGGNLVVEKYEKPLNGDILNNPFQQCKEPFRSEWCDEPPVYAPQSNKNDMRIIDESRY